MNFLPLPRRLSCSSNIHIMMLNAKLAKGKFHQFAHVLVSANICSAKGSLRTSALYQSGQPQIVSIVCQISTLPYLTKETLRRSGIFRRIFNQFIYDRLFTFFELQSASNGSMGKPEYIDQPVWNTVSSKYYAYSYNKFVNCCFVSSKHYLLV